jgi:predicted KAP-like P-loop ATPase
VVIVEPEQLLLFERVYAHRQSTGEWPRLEHLQRLLASEHIDVNVRALVMRSAEYVGIISPDEQVRLSLRGLGAVPAAQPLLEAYRQLLHSIVERYRDPQLEASYSSADFDTLELEPTLKGELSDLLRDDAWALGSGGGDGDSWSYAISDQVLRAGEATNVDELLAVRFGGPARQETEPSVPEPEPLITKPGASPAVDADRPIVSPAEDLLDRMPLAQVLATQATAQLGHGFVMGVAGPWGSGKTSLLELITRGISESETGYVVRFDPWLFSSSEELVLRFLREVQAQLGRTGKLGEVAAQIGEYAQILAPVSALVGVPWLAAPLSIPARALRRRQKKQAEVSAQQQREKVATVLGSLDRRLVVVIDDLDRLTPEEVRDVVRLVKLVADFPNTTYVLAYDQQRVACALGNGDEQDGHEFLEKIVQLTHEVPPVSEARLARVLADSISAAIGDLSQYEFDESQYANLFAHVRGLFGSVRDVRRYTNVLPGTLALTGNEVELADVLALEALRVRVPSSFTRIIGAQQALTRPAGVGMSGATGEEVAKQQIEAIIHAAGSFAEEVSGIISRLFPAAARHLGGTSYSGDWLASWRQARRVAHPEVLGIYLTKALPPGVLPVALVEDALENLEDRDALIGLLGELDDEQFESLLERLEHYEDQLPSAHPEVAIEVFYNQQYRLERPRRHALDLSAEFRVPRIVLRLLRKLDEAQVVQAVAYALPNIRTLSDRGHLVRSVGYRENSGHKLVTEQEAKKLEDAILDEVLSADSSRLEAEPALLRLLFWARGERPDDTRHRVEQLLEDDTFLLALLRAAVHEVVSQNMGDAAVQRSYELEWESLTTLVSAELLADRVTRLIVDFDGLDSRAKLALQLARERVKGLADS